MDCNQDGEDTPPEIERITKRVPGYAETWEPEFGDEGDLTHLTMTRSTGTVIHERYVPEDGSLPQQIPVQFVREVDGLPILNLVKQLDASATQIRVGNLAGHE